MLAFGFCFTCIGYIRQICLFESDVGFGKRLLTFSVARLKKKRKKKVSPYLLRDVPFK